MNRKTATALISALILALHSAALCTAAVPDCSTFSVSACHDREQGCHEQQRHERRESQRCVCCVSVACAPSADLTRLDGRSASDRVAAFAPLCIALLPLNPARSGGSLPSVSESPPHSPVRVFLIQKTLLI